MQNCIRIYDCYTDTNNFPLVLFYSFFMYSDNEGRVWMMIVISEKIYIKKKKTIKINI